MTKSIKGVGINIKVVRQHRKTRRDVDEPIKRAVTKKVRPAAAAVAVHVVQNWSVTLEG